MRGHINLVQFLLEQGAQVNAEGAQINGRTALEGAAENGHLDTVQLLLNAGAEGLEDAAELAEGQRHYVIARLLRMENEKRGNAV
jgi:ankyrin repeat protein